MYDGVGISTVKKGRDTFLVQIKCQPRQWRNYLREWGITAKFSVEKIERTQKTFDEALKKRMDEELSRKRAIKPLAVAVEEVKEEYLKILSDPFIQTDPQFKTYDDRRRYALAVLRSRHRDTVIDPDVIKALRNPKEEKSK